MAYPQPSANEYATNGGGFFRLNTLLTSPGDIYESEQSGHGLALGPLSDVANVNIAYFDGQVPTGVNQIQVGPPRSFVGPIYNLSDTYAPSQRPGRIMLWPSDLYDPSFLPSTFDPAQDSLTFITPVLDVIQYFSPQPALVPTRNDKTYRFPEIETAAIRDSYLVLPYWGRKYACCRIVNSSGATLAWSVVGIVYYPNDQTKAMEFVIDKDLAVPIGGTHTSLVRAAVSGMFDALMIVVNITGGSQTPFEVIVSDTPA